MFKKIVHLLLAGLLIFTSFGQGFPIAAQETSSVSETTSSLTSNEQPPAPSLPENFSDEAELPADSSFSEEVSIEPLQTDFFPPLPSEPESSISNLVSSIPNLKITEVYRRGSNERREVTNFDNIPFTGAITFSGLSKDNQTTSEIVILPHQSLIFGKKPQDIENATLIIHSGFSVSKMTDDESFGVEILVNTLLVDSFIAP
jgi:V8-like Glu-specific endopeptidase